MTRKGWILLGVVAVAVAFGFVPWGTQTSCVVAGTLIDTPDGRRPVESLRVGDRVYADDGGALVVGTVAAVREDVAEEWLTFTAPRHGGVLALTARHPLRTARGWIEAGALEPGAHVRTRAGWHRLGRPVPVEGRRAVYDLTVEPWGNFYAAGVLVHNKSWSTTLVFDATADDVVGTWVGWDVSEQAPACRLVLERRGRGACALVWEGKPVVYRVLGWSVDGDAAGLEVRLASGERTLKFEGSIHEKMLLLDYKFDDFAYPCYGPLHLVREGDRAAAADQLRAALGR